MTKDPILVGSIPVKITDSEESGTVWLCEDGSSELCKEVFVYHAGRSVREGLRLAPRYPNGTPLEIKACGAGDYFMAVSKGDPAYVVVDVVGR